MKYTAGCPNFEWSAAKFKLFSNLHDDNELFLLAHFKASLLLSVLEVCGLCDLFLSTYFTFVLKKAILENIHWHMPARNCPQLCFACPPRPTAGLVSFCGSEWQGLSSAGAQTVFAVHTKSYIKAGVLLSRGKSVNVARCVRRCVGVKQRRCITKGRAVEK